MCNNPNNSNNPNKPNHPISCIIPGPNNSSTGFNDSDSGLTTAVDSADVNAANASEDTDEARLKEVLLL